MAWPLALVIMWELPINSSAPDFELLFRHASVLASGEAATVPLPLESRQPSHSWFAREHHLASGETTYPLTRDDEIDICFVVPWLRLWGVDQCVLKLAEAVKRSVKGVRLHLLLTDLGVVDFDRAQLSVFDEIVSVAYCRRGRTASNAELPSKQHGYRHQHSFAARISGFATSAEEVTSSSSSSVYFLSPWDRCGGE